MKAIRALLFVLGRRTTALTRASKRRLDLMHASVGGSDNAAPNESCVLIPRHTQALPMSEVNPTYPSVKAGS